MAKCILTVGDKVRVNGSIGKIIQINGVGGIRVCVQFDNGVYCWYGISEVELEPEREFKVGDKVAWKDANGYIRVGIMKERFPTGTYLIKTREIPFYVPEDRLFPAGNLLDTEEATEEFRKKLDEGFFDKANEELSGEEIVKMIKAVSDVKLEPIGLTREMLGIDQAVIAGRNKKRGIEDVKDYIAEELEAEYQRGYLDGAQQLSRQTEKARHNIIKCCLEDIINTIDATPEELRKALEDL